MRGRIFISYRRDDAPGDATNLYKGLVRRFGKANVFMDVDKLLAGQRFDRELDKALAQCNVLIAVIGPRWMELLSDRARSRERDFVHDEIAAALKRNIVVIPVLIGREERMPSLPPKNDLPEDIRELVLYHKHSIAHERSDRDIADLIVAITLVLRGGRRVVPRRAIAISGAIGLALIAALLGYRMDVVPWIGPSAVQPRPVTDAATVMDAARKKEEVARKKAADEDASRQAAAAAKGQADADTAKKNAEEEADRKKAADEDASRLAAAAAKRQADADAARKKAEEEAAGKKVAADCDRLAASPADTTRPSGVPGVDLVKIDAGAAAAACDDAMRRYPDVTRFIYQAARAADARSDSARAMELYRKASAAGSAAAMNGVGELYRDSEGVAQDYSEARKWLEKGAVLGNSDAMNNLGALYGKGQGVAQDFGEARKWYEKAATLGNVIAMANLGTLYTIGQGVKPDYVEALSWYQKAAALGEPRAMTGLGFLYSGGRGVPQSDAEARKWYEKAAALGNAIAMYNLGIIYEQGQGVPKSREQARKWYQKAAGAGDTDAREKLKNLK